MALMEDLDEVTIMIRDIRQARRSVLRIMISMDVKRHCLMMRTVASIQMHYKNSSKVAIFKDSDNACVVLLYRYLVVALRSALQKRAQIFSSQGTSTAAALTAEKTHSHWPFRTGNGIRIILCSPAGSVRLDSVEPSRVCPVMPDPAAGLA